MNRIFSRGRYANVTSTLALVVALGGTSYAAIKLPKDSVGTTQIKTHGVTATDLANDAVTSRKIKDGSLKRVDFKAGELAAAVSSASVATPEKGATGPTGPAGPAGAAGPAGPTGPAGTAAIGTTPVAFGDFAADGTLQLNTTPSSLVAANQPTHTATGVYCFAVENLPFAPKSAVVTGDNMGNHNDTIATALTFNNPQSGCEVRVRTTDHSGKLADRAFSILLLG